MQCIEGLTVDSLAHVLAAEFNNSILIIQNCVWKRNEPSALVFFIYAFVVPMLALFGICANFINAIVFMRPKMTPSAFSYLAALSWLDCFSCFLIILTAFSRSILFNSTFWLAYDFQWQTPLFGMTTGSANLILGCVSCDRLVYLRSGVSNSNGPPRFCRRKVARRMIFLVFIISIIVNFPYFFVFVVNKDDGTFKTTKFYYSDYYKVLNWFTFILLTILPAIFLFIGNAAILIAFRHWTKQSKKIQNRSCTNSKTTQKRYKHQMKLTITIVIVITLYMVGELPAHLTSRKCALNLLYGGDVSKVNFQLMERLEIVCIMLNSLQLSLNIMVYAVINPSFMPEFFICLHGASDACFKIFGITLLLRCWKRCTGSAANGSQEELDNSYVLRADERHVSSNSWCSEAKSADDKLPAFETPQLRANIVTPSNGERFQPTACKENTLFTVPEHGWKRSSSLSAFAFYNYALELETTESVVRETRKRHSLAF